MHLHFDCLIRLCGKICVITNWIFESHSDMILGCESIPDGHVFAWTSYSLLASRKKNALHSLPDCRESFTRRTLIKTPSLGLGVLNFAELSLHKVEMQRQDAGLGTRDSQPTVLLGFALLFFMSMYIGCAIQSEPLHMECLFEDTSQFLPSRPLWVTTQVKNHRKSHGFTSAFRPATKWRLCRITWCRLNVP